MKMEFTNIIHRADMLNKFAGTPWSKHSHFLEKSPPSFEKQIARHRRRRWRSARGGYGEEGRGIDHIGLSVKIRLRFKQKTKNIKNIVYSFIYSLKTVVA